MHKKIRPTLLNLVNEGTTSIEKFQNEVLRPVIKMQHSLLIAIFNNYLDKKKKVIVGLSKEKQKEAIKSILTKDIQFKNKIIGCVIGHFSDEEIIIYIDNQSEINRRIIQIIIQRLQDSFA